MSIKKKDLVILENIKKLKKREWKKGLFERQSWGHSLHRIGPYVGRIKPSFAHFVIKYLTKPNDVVLDPFCGIGTISLESALQGRSAIGVDLNPYAIAIAKSKTQTNLNEKKLIEKINKIKIHTKKIDLSDIPSWVKNYYNYKTLKEIYFLLSIFKKNKNFFLYGCLLAISQGHRIGHLSKPSAWTLPFKPKDDDPGEYREVKPRLISKVIRNLKDGSLNKKLIEIRKGDSKKIKLKPGSVDIIISSPPYYNTLDYVNSHRLRLANMGIYKKNTTQSLRKKTIQHFNTYLEDMEKVIINIKNALKRNGLCVFILGDCFKGKKIINTSKEIRKILERNGFYYISTVNDQIPINKSIQKKTKNIKYERILIVRKI